MVSFEIFVKAMPLSLSELKVLPSFCFAFKIPDDRAASTMYVTSTMTSPLTKTAKTSKWLRLHTIQPKSCTERKNAPTLFAFFSYYASETKVG